MQGPSLRTNVTLLMHVGLALEQHDPAEAAEEREYKPWLAPGDYSPADTIWVTADTRSTRDVPEARRGPPSCGYGYVEST